MNSPRLQKLIEFLKEEPDNPFLVYGLAMEYSKIDYEKACEYFDLLLREHPDYVPTYYTYAHMLWEEEEMDKAKEVFVTGIAKAEEQSQDKALHELKAAFYNFEMENDY